MALGVNTLLEACGLRELCCEFCGVDLTPETVLFGGDPPEPLCHPCCEDLFPQVFKAAMARAVTDLRAAAPHRGVTEIDPAALAQATELLEVPGLHAPTGDPSDTGL